MTAPVAREDLRLGDVTCRSPGAATATTHRVVAVHARSIETCGDINGSTDALPVTSEMLVGRAILLAPGVVWAVRLAPFIAVGAAAGWLLTRQLGNRELQGGLRVIGSCAVVTIVTVLQHPLVGWTVLAQDPVGKALMATIAATGLLPIHVVAMRGALLTLVPGAVGQLRLPADPTGRVRFDVALGLEPSGWLLLVLVCLPPVLVVLVVGLPPKDVELVRPG